ncbi:Protein W07B8.3 [Aphelenchoides avenae]|nr:Protein W07B8.3 [Aphelenchus avenae]
MSTVSISAPLLDPFNDPELIYKPHEARIHETIFDSLSRPFSRAGRREQGQPTPADPRMGVFSDVKIPWNHFGKKHRLYFNRNEIDRADLFDLLMRRVHEAQPNFQGVLAYNDYSGRQVLIENDGDIRHAVQSMGNKLKIHTTVAPERGYIAAADMAQRGPSRSQSVPPTHSRHSPMGDRSPSSLDSNFNYRSYDRQSAQSPISNGNRQVQVPGTPLPPGYSYSYSSVGPAPGPLLYGMPPHNALLSHFLLGGHYSPFYRGSWIGPSKYLYNWGPHWAGGHKGYYRAGWGPVW